MRYFPTDTSRKSQKNTGAIWCAALLALLLLPAIAAADSERYVLRFNDTHLRGFQNDPVKLYLKTALRQQYPWVNPADLRLKRVTLVGKSKHGRGRVQLKVGANRTDQYRVGGQPYDFNSPVRHSFDWVTMKNPAGGSRGPWQVQLRGNFVVRKVVLEVREKEHQHRWYGQYRYRGHGEWNW